MRACREHQRGLCEEVSDVRRRVNYSRDLVAANGGLTALKNKFLTVFGREVL